MANISADISSSSKEVQRKAQRVAGSWVKPLARIGYIAKGVVYVIVGVIAVQAAFGTDTTEGSKGAIRSIADQPFGQVLLILMAIGLAGYVAWRFAQSVLNAEDEDDDAKGIIKRIFYAVSGLAYASLAFLAVRTALGSSGGSGSGSTQQAWTAELLSQPFGQWLVGLFGAVVIAVGVRQFYKAYQKSFMNSYNVGEMSQKERRVALRAGQFGLSARGVTFGIIGWFFIQAALQHDPSEARGLDAALSTLANQPYGPWLLAAVAIGFVAYGVHCFVKARYRHFETD